MAVVGGALAAPLGLGLYRWMDAVWPAAGFLVASCKFTLDQVVGCMLWQAAYLTISPHYRQMARNLLDAHDMRLPALRPLPAVA